MQHVSSLVIIYSVVHFEANRSSKKTSKNVKPFRQPWAFRSELQSTVEKEYVVHWWPL